ncbi:chromosome condensation regulator [Acrocarpospora pleiomorpha]|uniref:Chromosome condensation regulator n=1 Tax=Acrocarpospora pleiomorpha TaxID=90975 RepID=A0A5M3XS61_9ACTN|nr:PASTA domain-containing protein [Acrocarpospora pleiomorpha]GES24095.1 chromosome condensation regulator [Acrocarpospora pleiomorpha]
MKRLGLVVFAIMLTAALGVGNAVAAVPVKGFLTSWGLNHRGQIGDGTTDSRPTPVVVGRLPSNGHRAGHLRQVSAGSDFTAGLRKDGVVFVWGNRRFGDDRYESDYATTPEPVPGLSEIGQLSVGAKHILALGVDGTVWAWGDNEYRQLGDGTQTRRPVPQRVAGLTGIIQVSAGYRYSLALASDGTVWAWGHNGYAELGDGTTVNRPTPVKLSGISGVTQIAASAHGVHSMARRSDGTVWTWGNNASGQLGLGGNVPRYIPTKVPGLTGVTSISAGERSGFAVADPERSVWAWGSNMVGQLGDGTTAERRTPVRIPLSHVTQIEAGGGGTTAALLDNRSVWTWGSNEAGALGTGDPAGFVPHPSLVPGVADVEQISVGRATVTTIVDVHSAPPTPTDPPAVIQVPDLIGTLRDSAVQAISSAGLNLGSEGTVIDDQCNEVGQVIRQSPAPGTSVAPGSNVSIVVAVRPDHPCP